MWEHHNLQYLIRRWCVVFYIVILIFSDLFSVSFLIIPKYVFVLISVDDYIDVSDWLEPLSVYVELELFIPYKIYLQ